MDERPFGDCYPYLCSQCGPCIRCPHCGNTSCNGGGCERCDAAFTAWTAAENEEWMRRSEVLWPATEAEATEELLDHSPATPAEEAWAEELVRAGR
jgi:hypothetical protein